jgi:hypothetical protein
MNNIIINNIINNIIKLFKKKLIANSIMEESHSLDNSAMQQHPLNDEWCLWAHLPHDTDWSLNSYKNIYTPKTVEEIIAISNALPAGLVKNCMLFVMRKGITPLWEDPKNRKGGCFSYKINNKNVHECWKNLTYNLVGESLSKNKKLQLQINGITISPKKNFCIIKIWLANCDYQDASLINCQNGMDAHGCLFKKHCPEY